jgi:hypothetical protein
VRSITAAGLAACAILLSATGCAMSSSQTGMINNITCTHLGAGHMEAFTPSGQLKKSLDIKSATECSWAFLSEYTAGATNPVQTWANPPTQVVLANDQRTTLPGSEQYIFLATSPTCRVVTYEDQELRCHG